MIKGKSSLFVLVFSVIIQFSAYTAHNQDLVSVLADLKKICISEQADPQQLATLVDKAQYFDEQLSRLYPQQYREFWSNIGPLFKVPSNSPLLIVNEGLEHFGVPNLVATHAMFKLGALLVLSENMLESTRHVEDGGLMEKMKGEVLLTYKTFARDIQKHSTGYAFTQKESVAWYRSKKNLVWSLLFLGLAITITVPAWWNNSSIKAVEKRAMEGIQSLARSTDILADKVIEQERLGVKLTAKITTVESLTESNRIKVEAKIADMATTMVQQGVKVDALGNKVAHQEVDLTKLGEKITGITKDVTEMGEQIAQNEADALAREGVLHDEIAQERKERTTEVNDVRVGAAQSLLDLEQRQNKKHKDAQQAQDSLVATVGGLRTDVANQKQAINTVAARQQSQQQELDTIEKDANKAAYIQGATQLATEGLKAFVTIKGLQLEQNGKVKDLKSKLKKERKARDEAETSFADLLTLLAPNVPEHTPGEATKSKKTEKRTDLQSKLSKIKEVLNDA